MTALIVTYYSSPGPLALQGAGRGYVNPLCSDIIPEPSLTALKSLNHTEDYTLDNPTCSLQSQVRVNRFLDALMVFNHFLSPLSCQCPKYHFLERKLFVTISNAETTTLDRANKAIKLID
jgi:hypothetical protein